MNQDHPEGYGPDPRRWRDLADVARRTVDVVAGDVLDPADVTTKEARHMVLGPDDVLVVVFPTWVGTLALKEHEDRLRETLGKRFVLIMGDGVQLAKIKDTDWARGTHEQ
jgi:hypothetical protein